MRLIKLNTRLDSDGRAVIYSEWSKNFPELNGYLTSPENVYELGKVLKFDSRTEEHLYMFCLNNRNRILSFFELSAGTVNSTVMDSRSIAQKALLANAVNIILIHNHPSGDPTPSRKDVQSTAKVVKGLDLLNIEVLDHIIIGSNRFESLKESKYIDEIWRKDDEKYENRYV